MSLVFVLMLVSAKRASFAIGPSTTPGLPARAFVVVDNSWSMTHRVGLVARMDEAVSAAEHWATALAVPSFVTVELLSASDLLELVGTFALRSAADRAALIDAIRRIQPVRNTQLIENIVQMILHRLFADEHPLGHFLILETLRHQDDNLPLALTERRTLISNSQS